MEIVIREYRQGDAVAVRQCIVELQEFERSIDSRLRPGDSMADDYWEHIQRQCAEANGRVLVADHEGAVVGFVAVLAGNVAARSLYLDLGFVPHLEVLIKRW